MKRLFGVLLAGVLGLGGASAWAHDVKDPVCRMTVDSDTTKFKHKLGNKSFYFCSKQCETRFAQAPAKYEKLAAELEKTEPHEYTVEFKTTRPAVAQKPVEMVFAIRYAEDKKLVRDFEQIHERWLHLLMVSEDLSWFEHQHPVRGEDGLFRLTWSFPRPGRYRLYADFTPADGDNQVKPLPLVVRGGPERSVPLRPDRVQTRRVGDYQVELRLQPGSVTMEKPVLLTYTVRDLQGRPLRNMQPFIGAPGHLIAISQDGKEVVHTHAIHASEEKHGEHSGLRVTPEMATEKGPAFSFKLTVPTSGLYKTWAQFMHQNRVITVPFTFQVADLWAKTPPTARAQKAGRQTGVQRATIVVDGGYQPSTLSVKRGKPVELTFIRKEVGGCGEVVQFPSLGLKQKLVAGGKTTVSLTPKKSGALRFTCGMAMYQGQLVVR